MSKLRVDLRFYAELITAGIFTPKEGLPLLGKALAFHVVFGMKQTDTLKCFILIYLHHETDTLKYFFIYFHHLNLASEFPPKK